MKKGMLILALIVSATTITEAQSGAEPPYGMSHIAAFSVFTDAVRNNDHEMALQYGLWMLEAQPRQISGVTTFRLDRQFERLIGVYEGIAEEESDPTVKRQNLEEADRIFDLTFEIFDEGEIDLYNWYQRRGRFYQAHHSTMRISIEKAFVWYEKAYEQNPRRFAEEGDGYFAGILLSHYVNSGERDKAMGMIEEVEGYAAAALREEIDRMRERLFESPEERIEFLESRLEGIEGEERVMMLMGLAELYEETGQRDKAVQTARELYDLNPDFNNTRRLADIYLSDGNHQSAIPYLEQLVELAASGEPKGRVLLELSETHQQSRNLQEARRYARQALSAGGVEGKAMMRISLIYAAAVSQCTGGRTLGRDDRTVYWLVLDYLDRALQADSTLRSDILRRKETYRGAMPTSEDKFFRGWETGDRFRIDGSIGECYAWINEETTVR
jgi:tetratricopeptide (TPR) repeat protein